MTGVQTCALPILFILWFGIGIFSKVVVVAVLVIFPVTINTETGLLGVNKMSDLDGSYLRPAQPVRPPHVLSAFPYIDGPDDRY